MNTKQFASESEYQRLRRKFNELRRIRDRCLTGSQSFRLWDQRVFVLGMRIQELLKGLQFMKRH